MVQSEGRGHLCYLCIAVGKLRSPVSICMKDLITIFITVVVVSIIIIVIVFVVEIVVVAVVV